MTLPHFRHWREIQKTNFRHISTLADFLSLSDTQRQNLPLSSPFCLNLPQRLAKKMAKATLDDPLFRQFVPLNSEALQVEGFTQDPIEDQTFRGAPRLLHKYAGRVLLLPTKACAMHCRYCFRQNFDYAEGSSDYAKELSIIEKDNTIHEVILSGGDPLSLSDTKLNALLSGIANIPHVHKVRFHTRFPIGIPERIDDSFLNILDSCPKQIVMIIHCNHPRELDKEVLSALKALQKLGIPTLNQSVLLRDVNDNVDALTELCETLSDHGIIPYYLHQLDRVQGAAHFEVAESVGQALISALAARLPGYCVPRYVREVPGALHKTPLLDPSG